MLKIRSHKNQMHSKQKNNYYTKTCLSTSSVFELVTDCKIAAPYGRKRHPHALQNAIAGSLFVLHHILWRDEKDTLQCA